VISLTVDDTRRLAQLVTDAGGLDALAALVDGAGRPARRPPLREPWKRDQVIAAYNLKLLTRAEARRLLGVRNAR
jgi:hypothetical protein